MLTNRIREAIAADHDTIENTKFSVALITGRIPTHDYLFSLAQLHHIHAALEEECAKSEELAPFFTSAMIRTKAIESDLASFSTTLEDFDVIEQTEEAIALIRQTAETNPLALIGCIYILEGSRMGSLMLAKPIAAALGRDPQLGNGIDYHVEGSRETPMRFRGWKATVAEAGFDSVLEDQIESAAKSFMKRLLHLYANLPVENEPEKNVA